MTNNEFIINQKLLCSKRFLNIILLLLMFTSGLFYAQEVQISGIVTDADGNPLPGTTILVKGTTNGTNTDFDGNFSLTVESLNTTVVVSFIGFLTQEIVVTDKSVIEVVLQEDSASLDEVVVTGYGTQRKEEITSAIVRVSPDQFNQGNVSAPEQLLVGKVAGLSITKAGGDPNQPFAVKLRGLSTIGANTQPLIVVDGIIGGSLDLVDPNDIASIDVLKDAAAGAIFGTRGSTGVIIVTTKSGSQISKPTLQYNSYLSNEKVSNYINLASPEQFLGFGGTDFESETDWVDASTQTAISDVHSLSYSNNSGSTNYRSSLNYRDVEGIIPGTGFKRLNARLNMTQKFFDDKLKLSSNISYSNQDSNLGFAHSLRYALTFNPTAPIYFNGDPKQGFFETGAQDVYNPVAINSLNTNLRSTHRLNTNFDVKYEILEGLRLGSSYSFQSTSDLNGLYIDNRSIWDNPIANGRAERSNNNTQSELFEVTADYNGSIGDLRYNVLGGYSYQKFDNEGFGVTNTNFITNEITFNNLAVGNGFSDPSGVRFVNSFKSEALLSAFFGRLNLSYDDKYNFSGSYRREGSSKFGANNRWGNFWGLSAGADIAKIAKLNMFDQLKFRVSYGVTGNPPVENYSFLEKLGKTSAGYVNGEYVAAIGPTSNPNPDLKWEVKKESNIGLDFRLLKDRLSGTIDYYIRNTEDLMNTISVPTPPNLFNQTLVNLGELESKGLEVGLNYLIIKKPDFTWDFSGTYSSVKTKLVKFNNLENAVITKAYLGPPGASGDVIRLAEGEEIGQIIGARFVGYDENGFTIVLDQDGNETIQQSLDNYVVIGNGLPDFELGINQNFTYKNFELNLFFRGSFGHDIVNSIRYFNEHRNISGAQNVVVTKYFDLQDNELASAFHSGYVEDGSFYKLDNATLGYNFDMSKSKVFSGIKVYATGQNLFTITDYTGADPEVRAYDPGVSVQGGRQLQYYGDYLAPGVDRNVTYFPTRTYTIGINVNF